MGRTDESKAFRVTARATILTVALEAGVSTSTVSQVMRGSGRISEKTREKVLSAAKRVNYMRNPHAAAMRSGQFREVGLLINQIANPFNAEVVAGVSDRLEADGYLVFVLDTRDETERQRRYLETLIGGARGGLLWVPANGTDKSDVELVVAQKMPTVTFLRQIPGGHFDHVGIENTAGTRDATEFLVGLGHKHIAFLGGEEGVDLRLQRVTGYTQVMEEGGLGPPVIISCHESKEAGAMAATALLTEHPEITAIVGNGDVVAMGATLGLTRMGLVVGRDVSVVGFDDTNEAALWTPPLTTLSVNAFGLGERLAQTLLDRIRDPDAPVRSTRLSARLTVRDSTGPVPLR